MKRNRQLLLALLLDVVGAGGALLVSIVTWQRLSAGRERPFRDVGVDMIGRDVDSAITALALVALAGVVAVLATRGPWRRLIGLVVALSGVGLVVRGVMATGAVSADRARAFIESHLRTVTVPDGTTPHVEVQHVWSLLSIVCGVLVLGSGALVAVRGGRWEAMSARYEAAPAPAPDLAGGLDADDPAIRTRAAASMWTALDRGHDPTTDPTPDPSPGDPTEP